MDNISLCIDNPVESVTDETLIVETAAWPIPFLINVLAALKGSQVLIFIYGLESRLGVLEWS